LNLVELQLAVHQLNFSFKQMITGVLYSSDQEEWMAISMVGEQTMPSGVREQGRREAINIGGGGGRHFLTNIS
jgi:hypothetical protein